ncbi:MAG: GIY-YIG nuclease family protein [Nitrospirae bacterium]|nr:MAG: GIY-YIG nuclease family protein [Nitrospirota bacterium]
MNTSATIKLFLPFGDAKKVRTAELSNWSGKAIAAPRSDLDHLLAREELSKPGVYILLGEDPENGNLMAYIGEAESVVDRIKQHKSKDFWNSAIAFVSKDENLTKSHIRYLEGRLIQIANSIGRYVISNAQSSGARLPESDLNDMEVFLERIAQLLPVLGSELLTPVVSQAQRVDQGMLTCKMKGAVATGTRTPSGFVVLKGSTAVMQIRESAKTSGQWVISLRNQLVQNGSLVEENGFFAFTKDVEFASPSAAAAVIHGGNAAGPIAWKDATGRTLKEIEGS